MYCVKTIGKTFLILATLFYSAAIQGQIEKPAFAPPAAPLPQTPIQVAPSQTSPSPVMTQTPQSTSATYQELAAPIDIFLKALQKNDIQGSWASTSPAFQEATPLDDFKKFLRFYPVLTNFKTYVIKDVSAEEGLGTVRVVLDPDKGAFLLEFKVAKLDAGWKIWSMKFELPKVLTPPGSSPTQQPQPQTPPVPSSTATPQFQPPVRR